VSVPRLPAALAFFLLALPAGGAGAAVPGRNLTLEAQVDRNAVEESSETRPIRLHPSSEATIFVEVSNTGSTPVQIRSVRLEGRVMGLVFYSYDTLVGMQIEPGATQSRTFPLDLGGLDRQAVGLIPSSVKLIDQDRRVVAEQSGVVDVRGSLFSVYGGFGLGVALLTLLSFAGVLLGLARHLLPANRWRRALRFLTPGLGLGLVINFSLSALRVFVPAPGRWATITVVTGLVFFGLGYLTPAPVDDDLELDELEHTEREALPPAERVMLDGRSRRLLPDHRSVRRSFKARLSPAKTPAAVPSDEDEARQAAPSEEEAAEPAAPSANPAD
jgi:hypothetical protein